MGDCCQQQFQHSQCVVIARDSQHIVFPDEACDRAVKPTSKPCERVDCPHWTALPWGECSASACGSLGLKTREVLCVRGEEMLDSTRCCGASQPEQAQPCRGEPCPTTSKPAGCPPGLEDIAPTFFCRDVVTNGRCNTFYAQFCQKSCTCKL